MKLQVVSMPSMLNFVCYMSLSSEVNFIMFELESHMTTRTHVSRVMLYVPHPPSVKKQGTCPLIVLGFGQLLYYNRVYLSTFYIYILYIIYIDIMNKNININILSLSTVSFMVPAPIEVRVSFIKSYRAFWNWVKTIEPLCL